MICGSAEFSFSESMEMNMMVQRSWRETRDRIAWEDDVRRLQEPANPMSFSTTDGSLKSSRICCLSLERRTLEGFETARGRAAESWRSTRSLKPRAAASGLTSLTATEEEMISCISLERMMSPGTT